MSKPPPAKRADGIKIARDSASERTQQIMFNQGTEFQPMMPPPLPAVRTPMKTRKQPHPKIPDHVPSTVMKATSSRGRTAKTPAPKSRRNNFINAATSADMEPPVSTPLHHRQDSAYEHDHAPDSNSSSSTVSSPPGTPFRFASFPASLPKVRPRAMDPQIREQWQKNFCDTPATGAAAAAATSHLKTPFQSPLRNIPDSQTKPGTVRKRMTFVESEFETENEEDYELDNDCSVFRDDSQNTSLSSLSVDGKTPVRINHLKNAQTPLSSTLNFARGGSQNSAIPESGVTDRAVWLSPILSDEKQRSTRSAETSKTAEIEKTNNPRARLNFNSLSRPIEESSRDIGIVRKRHGSADYGQSPQDDTTPARKMVDRKVKDPFPHLYNRNKTNSFPPATGDPIQSGSGNFAPFQIGVSDGNPHFELSPTEANFRLRLDSTQCSPIKSVPEDLELPTRMDMDVEKSPEQKKTPTVMSPSHCTVLSTQSGQDSTSTSKSRKLRPMPDMSAFDMGSNATVSSLNNPESIADPLNESLTSNRIPLSPMKKLCPPTPLRTPAWAHKNALTRQNSLVTTKVLAACPPQVIDGFSSLENSLMEDEKNVKIGTLPPNSSSTLERTVLGANDHDLNTSSKLFPPNNDSSEDDLKPVSKRRNSTGKFKAISLDSSSENESVDVTMQSKKITKQPRLSTDFNQPGSVSFDCDFENISLLGSGQFAEVYKVRSKVDNQFYAVKRIKRQFRGRRDRERALVEIRIMQRLQTISLSEWKEGTERSKSSYCLYLLFFIRAWQEDGRLFCQTELCCRDTCSHLMLNLTTHWVAASKFYPSLKHHLENNDHSMDGSSTELTERLVPANTIWKICHDVACGLSHIHSHNIVHHDIKPLNIFFVYHAKLGALCKIGDFGIAGEIGTSDDGQEGDTAYMPNELLRNAEKDPSGDIFSLGISLYELASSGAWLLPQDGPRWHSIRDASHVPELPKERSSTMVNLIKRMISPEKNERPKADEILLDNHFLNNAAIQADPFLADYIRDVDNFNTAKEKEARAAELQSAKNRQTPTPMQNRRLSGTERSLNVRTPTPGSGPFS